MFNLFDLFFLGVSVYYGRDIKQEVEEVIKKFGLESEVTEKRFHRDTGDYKELGHLCASTKNIWLLITQESVQHNKSPKKK